MLVLFILGIICVTIVGNICFCSDFVVTVIVCICGRNSVCIHAYTLTANTHQCIHTHARTHTYTLMHTRTHTHSCTHARIHTHAHTHARTHTHTHAHTHIHTHTHMHTHICVPTFVCILVLSIHTHRHMFVSEWVQVIL